MDKAGKVPEDIFKILEPMGQLISIPKGQTLLSPGSSVEAVIIPIQGSIRVYAASESGRSIALYWIEPRETCIIGTSCLFNDSKYPAFASSETDVQALAVPVRPFRDLFESHEGVRAFIFDLISARLMAVMELVSEVAFHKMDSRLAKFLLQRKSQDGLVSSTHDEIAQSLGTTREVISRLLRGYANQGWIDQSHSTISLKNTEPMAKLYNCD